MSGSALKVFVGISQSDRPEMSFAHPTKYVGKHLLIEVFVKDVSTLNRENMLNTMLMACNATGATIIHHHDYQFSPQGCSGVILLAESHASWHTFPELGYASVDIFTCGNCDPWKAVTVLMRELETLDVRVKEEYRGLGVS